MTFGDFELNRSVFIDIRIGQNVNKRFKISSQVTPKLRFIEILNDLHVVVIRSFCEILQLVFLEKHTEKWSFIE